MMAQVKSTKQYHLEIDDVQKPLQHLRAFRHAGISLLENRGLPSLEAAPQATTTSTESETIVLCHEFAGQCHKEGRRFFYYPGSQVRALDATHVRRGKQIEKDARALEPRSRTGARHTWHCSSTPITEAKRFGSSR